MTVRVYDIKWAPTTIELEREVVVKEDELPKEVEVEIDDDVDSYTIEETFYEIIEEELYYGFTIKDCNWKIVSVKDKIKKLLRRYFEYDDNGDQNPEFDEYFSAEEAIDEIHDIIGGI